MNFLIYVVVNHIYTQKMQKKDKHIVIHQDQITLKEVIHKIKIWYDNWLINLNIDKCKKFSFGRIIFSNYASHINNKEFENLNIIKHLGVVYDSNLKLI